MVVTPSEYRGAGHVYVGSVQETKDVERKFVALEERFRLDVGVEGHHEGRRGQGNCRPRAPSKRTKAGSVDDLTPPEGSGSRRDQAQAELRVAVGGREHEFIGIGLIGLAVLLGLAVYVNLAGPLGRGIETLSGWLFGLGRYAVPVVLVSVGVSLLRKGRSAGPFQLAIGWSLMSLSVLGLLQVARGAAELGDAADQVSDAGGWIGAFIGAPLEAMLERPAPRCCSSWRSWPAPCW